MIRPTTILALIILAGSAFGLFQVKYRVQALHRDLAEINRQLQEELSATHVLKAEWAYLNQPERLKTLVENHLQLKTITVSQLEDTTTEKPTMVAVAPVKLIQPKKVATAEKTRKMANNLPPLYPAMEPLLSSLASAR